MNSGNSLARKLMVAENLDSIQIEYFALCP